ncbi:hypothetical protein ACFE04_030611 [Oxalis oulophora]
MDNDGIMELDHYNFNRFVSKSEFVPVLFYQPHCHDPWNIIPEYEKASRILRREDSSVILTKLDTSKQINFYPVYYCRISSVPQIKILKSVGGIKKIEDYYHVFCDAQLMVENFKRLIFHYPAKINSPYDANKFIQHLKKTAVIVGVFPEFSGKDYDNFIVVADMLRWDYDFCITLDADLLPLGGSPVSGRVVRMFISFDNGFVDTEDFNVDAMVKFIKEESIPLITIYDHHPQQLVDNILADRRNDKVILFTEEASSEGANDFDTKYREVANKYKGQGLIFMAGGLHASKALSEYFGHITSKEPLIVIKNSRVGEYMRRQDWMNSIRREYVRRDVQASELETWVDDYKAGKVARFEISERIPEENNGDVKVVVGANYWDIVMESKENVLLGLYLPQFDNQLKFDSILCEVAKHFKDENDDDVIIAKSDVSVNDVRSENPYDIRIVRDSPTFYLIPSDGGYMSMYSNNDFTAEDLIDLINTRRYNLLKEPRTTDAEDMDSTDSPPRDIDLPVALIAVTDDEKGSSK